MQHCRFCGCDRLHPFLDLVNSPPSNAYLRPEQLDEPEVFYPLQLHVCTDCRLVQIDEYKKAAEIFDSEYAYFSSYSSSWLEHARHYTQAMTRRFGLGAHSQVVEIASNDGYLLQYFHQNGIPVLGIEPTLNTAKAAREKGVETWVEFFGCDLARRLAAQGLQADLLLGNNVLAHVPDLNDFVGGMKIALKPQGVITMEFPHLLKLVEHSQFDTVYHEHFSYLSLGTVKQIFERQGLTLFDVEELPTHGGSLRIYARHTENQALPVGERIAALERKEAERGMNDMAYYADFQRQADRVKYGLLEFLLDCKRQGKRVAAYGAAAKGNTLLNYCGIKKDLIAFVCDLSPHKQGKFLPGSHIPIVAPERLFDYQPDYILILPWNIKTEIENQLQALRQWGCRFVAAIPELSVW